jgi:molybdenum cofactor biosynthesis enzyme MoaA
MKTLNEAPHIDYHQETQESILEKLRVIVTNRCNMDCFFCHRDGNYAEDRNAHPEIGQLVNWCNQAINGRTKVLKISGGEPFVRKDLPAVVKTLKTNFGKEIAIGTNGTLSNQSLPELKAAGTDRMTFGVYSLQPEVLADIAKIPTATAEKHIAAILENSKAAVANLDGPVKWNYMLIRNTPPDAKPGNIDGLRDAIKLAGNIGISEIRLNTPLRHPLFPQEHFEQSYAYWREIIEDVLDWVAPAQKQDFLEQLKELDRTYSEYPYPTRIYVVSGNGVPKISFHTFRRNRLAQGEECPECDFKNDCQEGVFYPRLTIRGELKLCLLGIKR